MLTRRLQSTALALAGLFAGACQQEPQLTEAMVARLSAHASPNTWEQLDPTNPGRRLRDPRSGVVFVRIPAEPPFLLAETELTAAQWRSYTKDFAGPGEPPQPDDDTLPAQASWHEAQQYCLRFGFRLPTETEWEFAARGNLAAADGPWRDPNTLATHAWFHLNAGDAPRPVAGRAANAFGLFDMLGNVWEWCDAAVGTDRVLRGGSWFTNPAPTPQLRTQAAPAERNSFYGFRPARAL